MADLNLFIDRSSVPPSKPEKVEETVVKEELTGINADIFDFVDEFAEEITGEKAPIQEVSPPGWGHTKGPETGGSAKAFDDARKEGRFKGDKEDMFAIMWAAKNKGDKTHYKPKSNPPKKKKTSLKEDFTHISETAEKVSQFLGDTGKTVKREIAPLEERYELLEAKINKIQQITKSMFPGNPGDTIVSGIGASGDGSTQGGGAVWLWDLDDVNIGTPMNGVYPAVSNGAALIYDGLTNKWIPGESSSENLLEGGIINANGGSANTSGNLLIQSTNNTNGNLEIEQASGNTKFKVYGTTGNTDFKGGFVQIDRLATMFKIGQSNFTIHGRNQDDINAGTYTNDGDIFYGYSSHPQDTGTADAIQYAGRISDELDMVNKKYVDSAIDTGGGGIGFTFKGTCDVTLPLDNAANSDVVEGEGNFYINTVGGTAYNSGTTAQNWAGIGGLTISADQLIIWSESSSRWFAGAVENDTTYVKVDGSNSMTGGLIIAPSGSEGLQIKEGNTTNITLFKGGSAQFNNALTVDNNITCGGNVLPATNGQGQIGDENQYFSEVNGGKLYAYLDGSQFASFGPYGTTPDIGSTGTRFGTIHTEAVNTTQTSTMASILPQVLGNNLGQSNNQNNRWQHICGITANFSGTGAEAGIFGDINPSSHLLRNLGTSTLSWGNLFLGNLYVDAVRARANAGINIGTGTATYIESTGQNSGGYVAFQGGKNANVIFYRCTDNGMTPPQLVIKGKTDANDGDKNNDLLAVHRSEGNVGDEIRYHGKINDSKAIVNKAYVDNKSSNPTLPDWVAAARAGSYTDTATWPNWNVKYRYNTVSGCLDVSVDVSSNSPQTFYGTNYLFSLPKAITTKAMGMIMSFPSDSGSNPNPVMNYLLFGDNTDIAVRFRSVDNANQTVQRFMGRVSIPLYDVDFP